VSTAISSKLSLRSKVRSKKLELTLLVQSVRAARISTPPVSSFNKRGRLHSQLCRSAKIGAPVISSTEKIRHVEETGSGIARKLKGFGFRTVDALPLRDATGQARFISPNLIFHRFASSGLNL